MVVEGSAFSTGPRSTCARAGAEFLRRRFAYAALSGVMATVRFGDHACATAFGGRTQCRCVSLLGNRRRRQGLVPSAWLGYRSALCQVAWLPVPIVFPPPATRKACRPARGHERGHHHGLFSTGSLRRSAGRAFQPGLIFLAMVVLLLCRAAMSGLPTARIGVKKGCGGTAYLAYPPPWAGGRGIAAVCFLAFMALVSCSLRWRCCFLSSQLR